MALLSFRPRGPKSFRHQPIYWNPQKNELDKRINNIRRELIQEGKLSAQASEDSNEALYSPQAQEREEAFKKSPIAGLIKGTEREEDREERMHDAFVGGTKHLKRQEEKGVDAHGRLKGMMRSLLLVLLLGLLAYFLYFR